MKKFIITICLFAILSAPFQAMAFNEMQVREQYIKSLNEVIALLIQQVNELTLLLQIKIRARVNESRQVIVEQPIVKQEIKKEWVAWKLCDYELDVWDKEIQKCVTDEKKRQRLLDKAGNMNGVYQNY